MLTVPSTTTIRDLEASPCIERSGAAAPGGPGPTSRRGVNRWRMRRGSRIDVRDGSQGPLVVETVKRRVVSRTHRRQQGDEERLVVIRDRDRDNQPVVQVDGSLASAVPETPLGECARLAKAAHRIEARLQRSKSATGLADDEVRNWTGWQHQTLSLRATWFLVRATARGKKMDPGDDLPTRFARAWR